MRTGPLLLLSSLILAAIFVPHARSIDDTEGRSVDELIDESNGAVSPWVDPRFASNPHDSRGQWDTKGENDWTMPSKLSGSTESAKDSRAQVEAEAEPAVDSSYESSDSIQEEAASAQDESTTLAQDSTASTESTKTASKSSKETVLAQAGQAKPDPEQEPETSQAPVSGSWSFELQDDTLKEMVLTLFQSEDSVFGTGTIAEGNSTLIVTAAGTLDSDKLDLYLTSIGTINLYRLALTLDGDSASGDYKAFSPRGDSWIGSAEGSRSVPQN